MGFRATVVGGGGRIGGAMVHGLVDAEDCTGIVVADGNIERTKQRLEGVAKIDQIKEVSIHDGPALAELVGDADVVMNAVGPYYKHGTTVLEAAIDAGVDYVDVCDDIEPTLEMLKLHDRAIDKGVTAVVGCGNSPGFTNMIVASAADRWDEVLEAYMSWVVPLADGGGPGAGFHSVRMCANPAMRVVDGRLEERPSLSDSCWVELPEPFGSVRVFDVAHPEPVTLHQTFPTLQQAWNRGAILPAWEMDRLADWVRLGLGSEEPLQVGRNSVNRMGVAMALDAELRTRNPELELGPPISCTRVDVVGRKDGETVRETHLSLATMADGTGRAAVAGAQALSRGHRRRTGGVFAPEAVLEPTAFLRLVSRLGFEMFRMNLEPAHF